MTVCFLIEELAQLGGVDQVTIMRKADTVGRVDIKRLALGALCATRVSVRLDNTIGTR